MYLLYLMEGLASEPLIHIKNRVAQSWLSCKSSPWSHTEERTISRLSVYERRCWKGAVAYRTLHAPHKDPCGHKKASTHCSKSCLFCRKYVKSLKLHVKSPDFLMDQFIKLGACSAPVKIDSLQRFIPSKITVALLRQTFVSQKSAGGWLRANRALRVDRDPDTLCPVALTPSHEASFLWSKMAALAATITCIFQAAGEGEVEGCPSL